MNNVILDIFSVNAHVIGGQSSTRTLLSRDANSDQPTAK
jgi:hypothetical protein